jgi:cytosol alanyl aminopeptidase
MTLRSPVATLLVAWLCIATAAFAQPKPPDFRLGDGATPLGYEATLAIDPSRDDFEGSITIALRINRPQAVLWLNGTGLTVLAASLDWADRRVDLATVPGGEDFIGFTAPEALPAGEAKLAIRYRGKLDTLATRGLFKQQEGDDWYVLSQFEALSARRAYPCFDEPGWKTPWQVTLEVPAGLVAVSNTPVLEEMRLDDGRRRVRFKRTPPLPSYLVAMAVGPFDVVEGGTAGAKRVPLRYLTARGRGAEARYAKEVTPRLVDLLEDYFGIPYPFEKLDSVAIPQTVAFGAMENVGMITYAARLMQAKPHEENLSFRRRYASVAAHEIAHQWFGNLVTLAWWDDTWLNEAFASWLGMKTLYRFEPAWDDGWYRAYGRGRAIAVDRLASTRSVHNPVDAKGDVESAFDSITYDKGAEVLQMFESSLTPELFRNGVRRFLSRHAYGSATAQDFMTALAEESRGGTDTIAAFRDFIEHPGVPLIDVALDCSAAPTLLVSQSRFTPAGSKSAGEERWSTPACFRHAQKDAILETCGSVPNGPSRLRLAGDGTCPAWVLANANGAGYYVARYEQALHERIDRQAPRLPAPEATAMLNDSWLMAQSGLLPLDDLLEFARRYTSHPSPVVRRVVVASLDDLREDWLDASQRARYDRIMKSQVEPQAVRVGWNEKAGEDDPTRDLRVALLPVAADRGRSAPLRREAAVLADRWLERRDAIADSIVGAVLNTAGAFAGEAQFARLERQALQVRERNDRTRLLNALVKARDPALRDRALALALDQRVDGRDALAMVEVALGDDTNRTAAFAFMRDHFDALVAKVPEDTPIYFIAGAGRLCKARELAVFEAFFRERAARFNGGSLAYRQSLEAIELCVAARAAQGRK